MLRDVEQVRAWRDQIEQSTSYTGAQQPGALTLWWRDVDVLLDEIDRLRLLVAEVHILHQAAERRSTSLQDALDAEREEASSMLDRALALDVAVQTATDERDRLQELVDEGKGAYDELAGEVDGLREELALAHERASAFAKSGRS